VYFCCRKYASGSVNLTWLNPKATALGEITRNMVITPFKVIQGHSKSVNLVPIERAYATYYSEYDQLLRSYLAPFHTYLRLVIKLLLLTGVSLFNSLIWGEPLNLRP